MAAAYLQVAGANSSTNVVSVTFGSNNTAGNQLFALVGVFDGSGTVTISSITDSHNNTWVQDTGSNNGANLSIFALHVASCAAGANTVTVTVTAGGTSYFTEVYVYEFTGTSGVLDVANTAFGSSTTPSVSATTTGADVQVAYVITTGANAGTPGWIGSTVSSSNIAEYKITAGGAAQSATFTSSSTNAWLCVFASYKGGGIGPAYLQVAGANTSTNVVSVTFGSNNTAGNLLVAVIGCYCGTLQSVSSVADSHTNNWVQDTTANNAGNLTISAYHVASCAGGANTVTVTMTSGGIGYFSEVYVYEFSGCSGNLDVVNTAFGSTATPTVSATTVNADAIVAYVLGSSVNAGTPGWGQSTASSTNIAEYLITMGGGAQTASFSALANPWICVISSYSSKNLLRVTLPPGTSGATSNFKGPRLQSWTVRQSTVTDPSRGTSTGIAFPSNVVAGNLLVIAALDQGGSTYTSVVDSVGTLYAVAAANAISPGPQAYIFYGVAPMAGANTVFVQWSASTVTPNLWAYEISGSENVYPLDQSTGTTGTGTAVSSGAITVNSAISNNDFIFGYLFSTGQIASGETGWTQVFDFGSGTMVEYLTPQATGTYSATGTGNTSGNWIGLEAAFLPGAGGPGPLRFGPPFGSGFRGTVLIRGTATPHFNSIRVLVSGRIISSGKVFNSGPLAPGPILGIIGSTGVVHGTLRIWDNIFVTGVISARSVIRNPINTAVLKITSALTIRQTGLVRLQISGSINVNNLTLVVRTNPYRPGPLTVTMNVVIGTVTPRFGAIRVTLPPGSITLVNKTLTVEQTISPKRNGFMQAGLIKGSLGIAPGLIMNLTVFPLPPGTIHTSGTIPARPLYSFPHAHGTVSCSNTVLHLQMTGSLRQMVSGTINSSSAVLNVRLAGPLEITITGFIRSSGAVRVTLFAVPALAPAGATGLCVIGSSATWYDHETEVAQIFFETSADPSFLVITSSTSVPWVSAPILRSLLVPVPARFYRVRTTNAYGTSYSNISEQTALPPAPVTVNVYGYYVILDTVGADLIMELHPGKDYSYVVQSIIAGPFPDYVSALNEQALINI